MITYSCVSARFYFWNGKTGYTVQYNYGICTWFIFNDEEDRNAIWSKKINPSKNVTPNRLEAEMILSNYLN